MPAELTKFTSHWKRGFIRKSIRPRWKRRLKISARRSGRRTLSRSLRSCAISATSSPASQGAADVALNAVERMLAEIVDKARPSSVTRTPDQLQTIERLLQSLDAKLDFGAETSFSREIVGRNCGRGSPNTWKRTIPFAWTRNDCSTKLVTFAIASKRFRISGGMQALMRTALSSTGELLGEPASEDEDATPSPESGTPRERLRRRPFEELTRWRRWIHPLPAELRQFWPSMSTEQGRTLIVAIRRP